MVYNGDASDRYMCNRCKDLLLWMVMQVEVLTETQMNGCNGSLPYAERQCFARGDATQVARATDALACRLVRVAANKAVPRRKMNWLAAITVEVAKTSDAMLRHGHRSKPMSSRDRSVPEFV